MPFAFSAQPVPESHCARAKYVQTNLDQEQLNEICWKSPCDIGKLKSASRNYELNDTAQTGDCLRSMLRPRRDSGTPK